MSGVNKVIIVGRLGAEPDMRSTQNGYQVCTLSVATSDTWVKDGKKEEKTEWHRVILWGKLAELAQKFLKKGRMVYIEGKLQTRSWQDPQGQKRFTTEIVANTMQFIDGQGQGSQRDSQDFSPYDEQPPTDSYYSQNQSHNSSSNSGMNMYDNPSHQRGMDSGHGHSNVKQIMDDDIPF